MLNNYDKQYMICPNEKCGFISDNIIDPRPEWRFYGGKNADPTRCGMPINNLLKQSSYGCTVLCSYKSTYEMRKIKRYTEWQSMPYKEKSRYDEFERIKHLAKDSGISKIIVDCALVYHKKISDHKTFRGLNRNGIIAASIYISCRVNDFPRTAKEIAKIFKLDNTSATKGCKNAMSILNKLEKNMENRDKTYFHQTKPVAFIERFCSKLNINEELTKLCLFIAIRLENNHIIPENTPHSVAASIIYFVAIICDLNISKNEISFISNISEVTINKCFKKINKIKKSLIPHSIIKKYCINE